MKYVSLILSFVLFAGCEENKFKSIIESLEQLKPRVEIEAQYNQFTDEQRQIFYDYFYKISYLAVEINSRDSYRSTYNNILVWKDLNEVCGKLFISPDTWRKVNSTCRDGKYFLCSDEIKSYSKAVETFRRNLKGTLKRKFDQAPNCRTGI